MISKARTVVTHATSIARFVGTAILVGATFSASAQIDEHCTVSIMNRTAQVQHDGSWIINNVPATLGLVRARAVCVEAGTTRIGSSTFVSVPRGGSVEGIDIIFETVAPIPASLSLSTANAALEAPGATTQLTTTAAFSNGSRLDVTPGIAGTTYRSSNPAVATVSADGLVTARASGNVIVSATHEGTLALTRITVASVLDSDGDGMPDDYEVANGFNPYDPSDALSDFDGDGLTNVEEYRRATNPKFWDTDGDGINDGLEVLVGSDPLNPASFDLSKSLHHIDLFPQPTVDVVFESLLGTGARRLRVTGQLIDAGEVDITQNYGTTYSTGNGAIAAVDTSGHVAAAGPGTTSVTAANFGFSATAPLNVTAFTPSVRGVLQLPNTPKAIAFLGRYVFVATMPDQRVSVIDAQNPDQPALLSTVAVAGYAGGRLLVDSGNLYVADANGVTVVDVSVPTAPRVADHFNVAGVRDIAISNGFLVLATPTAVVVQNQNVINRNAVWSTFALTDARAVVNAGTRVVVLDGSSVLRVIDYSANFLVPTMRGSVQLAGGTVLRGWGDYAYVNSQNGLATIDIRQPQPTILSTLTTLPGSVKGLDVLNGFAFAALDQNGAAIVDIGEPTAPLQRFVLQIGDGLVGVVAARRFVYAIQDLGGSTRFSISQYIGTVDDEGRHPDVRITSPLNGTSVVEGALVPISILADDDFIVDSVSLFADNRLVTSTKARPATVRFRVPLGATSVVLSATAVDFGINTGQSQPITVNVVHDLTPPTVQLTAPTTGNVSPHQLLQVIADASDDGSIASVEFFVNGASIARTTTVPYQTTYSVPDTLGSITFTATATDAAGKSTTSSSVTVTVTGDQPPTVHMRTPNTSGLFAGGDLLVSADATDDVAVYYVQYYMNGQVVLGAYSFNPPYKVWLHLPPGQTSVRLSAVAFDRTGHSAFSDEITIAVAPTSAVSAISLSAFPQEMVMQGTYAYVAANEGGLLIVDASNPAAMSVVGSLPLPGRAVGVRVSGHFAFIASDTGGLCVIDVSDSHAPVLVASLPLPASPTGLALATGVHLDGDRAFVTAADGVHIVDVRNPLAPQPVSVLETALPAAQMVISGNTLYIASAHPQLNQADCHSCSDITAYDITTPSSPQQLGTVVTQTAGGLSTPVPTRLDLAGNRLYVAGRNYISIIDVADPRTMRELGLFDAVQFAHCCWQEAKLRDGLLFTTGFDSPSVQMLNVDEPGSMLLVGRVDFGQFDPFFAGTSVVATPQLVFAVGSNAPDFLHFYNSPTRHLFAVGQYRTVNDAAHRAPTVAISRPLAGVTVFERQAVPIRVDASDDVAVASVQIAVDGQPIATLVGAPYTYLWTAPVGSTQHTITATATDFGGNSAAATPVIVHVVADVTPPTIHITAPVSSVSVLASSITLRAAATDNFSVTAVAFSVNGQPVATSTTPPYEVAYVVPAGTSQMTVSATATDQAGNTGSAPDVTVSLVPQAGSLALPGHANEVVINGGHALVAAGHQWPLHCRYQGRRVAAVTFTVNGRDVLTDTVAPYDMNYLVPRARTSITIGPTATDFAGSVGHVSPVILPVTSAALDHQMELQVGSALFQRAGAERCVAVDWESMKLANSDAIASKRREFETIEELMRRHPHLAEDSEGY